MKTNISKSSAILIIIIAFLTLLIIDGVIFIRGGNDTEILDDQANERLDNNIDKFYTSTINNIKNINNSETDEWESYNNKNYNFQFKYPNYFRPFFPPISDWAKDKEQLEFGIVLIFYDEITPPINLLIHDKPLDSILADLKEKADKKEEEIKNNNINAQKFTIQVRDRQDAFIVFSHNNKTYTFSGKDDSVLMKIFNTFSFIE